MERTGPPYLFKKRVLTSGSAGRHFFLFLDFDGTLVPIQDDPGDCRLSDGVRHQLEVIVASGVSIGVLSGRSLPDIKERVLMEGICYGGCHGLEITGPRIRYTHPAARWGKRLMAKVREELQNRIGAVDGVLLEDKGLTLAIHYRRANHEDSRLVRKELRQVLLENNTDGRLAVMRGKKVFELVPNVLWDKGRAALLILQSEEEERTPIYVGDDLTDERAFQALNRLGITVRVGKSNKTAARYYLTGQSEVPKLLEYVYEAASSVSSERSVQ